MEATMIVYFFLILFYSNLYGLLFSFLFHSLQKILKRKIFKNYYSSWSFCTASFFLIISIYILAFNGYRGIGPFKIIHIKNNQTIKQDHTYRPRDEDGNGSVYFQQKTGEIMITKFIIKNDSVFGQIYEDGSIQPRIVIWNTKTNTIKEYPIDTYEKIKNYPSIKNFKTFNENYDSEWFGYRRWLLP